MDAYTQGESLVPQYTITVCGRDGETLGATRHQSPAEVTGHLLGEMRSVHALGNLGKRWTVTTPGGGATLDRDQWLHSRPQSELMADS